MNIIVFFSSTIIATQLLGAFGLFNRFTVTLVAIGMLAFFLWKNQKIKIPRASIFTQLIIPIVFLALIFLTQVTPIYETDSVAYHLPIITQLAETGSIWDVYHAAFVGPNTYFPANQQSIQAFFYVLTGSYAFTALPTLLSILLFIFAFKTPQASFRLSTLLAVLLVTSVPFLFEQIVNVQVDLFSLCLFGSMVCFLYNAHKSKDEKELTKFFLTAGIFLGTKYNSLPQFIFLIPLIGICFYKLKLGLKKISTLLFLMILTGSGWYLRNWIIAGNPFFPFEMQLPFITFQGYEPFNGQMAGTTILDAFKNQGLIATLKTIKANTLFTYNLGSSIYVLAGMGITSVILVFSSSFKKDPRSNLLPLLAFVYLFIGEIFYYLSSPFTFTLWNQTIRYSAPLFALLAVIIVWATLRVPKFKFIIWPLSILIIIHNIFFASFVANPEFLKDKDNFIAERNDEYKDLLPTIQTLREQNPRGQNIAVAGILGYWFFEKEGLKPHYINVDGCNECKYPDYAEPGITVRSFPDKQKWLKALQERSINYLLVSKENELLESKWAQEEPQIFEELVESKKHTLYKLEL